MTPQKEKTAIEKIEGAIAWFSNVRKDFADIDTLLRVSTLLATANFEFARETGESCSIAAKAELRRKVTFANLQREAMEKQQMSAAAAKSFAESHKDYQAAQIDETEQGAYASQCKLLLSHSRDVLETMRQRIAHLRYEKQVTNFLPEPKNLPVFEK